MGQPARVRVLVVDDSTLFRKVVRDALESDPGVEIVGTAANGRVALEKIEQLKPDLVTLDVEMPELDGLGVLEQLRERAASPSVIMVSALTSQGAELTTRALSLGAFDFILKPHESDFTMNCIRLRDELLPKIHLAAEARQRIAAAHLLPVRTLTSVPAPMSRAVASPDIVAIGISTGGPAALSKLLPQLPADFPVPIVIVQHMPPMFTRSLAEELDRTSALHIQEAVDNDRLQPGNVYIAPGGHQTKVEQGILGFEIRITDDPPERSCRPSVDYLFRSLANLPRAHVLAVVMTGMGDDGSAGCKLLKQHSARVIAQSEESCVVYGMPRNIVELGLADVVSPLESMHKAILESFVWSTAKC